MTQLVPAARQLIEQVQNINEASKAIGIGPADGFNRIRNVEFDARTSKWLAPALEAVADSRIEKINYEGKGRAIVTFVGTTVADRRDPFPIEDALRVLKGEE